MRTITSLVGNAESLFDREYGSLIDEGQIVIRFNDGIIIDPVAQGTKTTVVACSRRLKKRTTLSLKPDNIWKTTYFRERRILEEKLGCRPSNGITVLYRLKMTYGQTKQNHLVRVFGFDWKETKTWYADKMCVKHHDFEAERELCLDILDEMGWELYR